MVIFLLSKRIYIKKLKIFILKPLLFKTKNLKISFLHIYLLLIKILNKSFTFFILISN